MSRIALVSFWRRRRRAHWADRGGGDRNAAPPSTAAAASDQLARGGGGPELDQFRSGARAPRGCQHWDVASWPHLSPPGTQTYSGRGQRTVQGRERQLFEGPLPFGRAPGPALP